ncbi:glycosyltransferase [Cereibacter azotoformans]|uniref:Glycosyl transferase family 2 n=1 Tax=Cereibacter azotoformans TaxID=43057 RepID=A0A2T5K5V6_9RHOB|nr:glycosyltransferase [Cereibacter azotoformans]AXQ95584.1 glycosyltransferase [Cereibacter sphaeroides]PTR17772.1 glycosyl transferase family 2 [Cereibacter azotoformans]UIJ32169.1 glycosyltransferase [Cereibacter azotoformans]
MSLATVTCLIPAFNEGRRIGAVLAAACANRLVDEVIVIDDGSTDDTAEVAERAGVRVLRQPANRGKSAALARGIAAAQGDLILLLDADLRGLTANHVTDLLAPVLLDEAEGSLSLRGNAPLPWRLLGLDYISGERVLPRALLADRLDAIARLPRFGFEAYLNALWIASAARLAVVRWPDVASPAKAGKRGLAAGLLADALMLGDIFRTIPPHRALGQIVALQRQRLSGHRRLPLVPILGR